MGRERERERERGKGFYYKKELQRKVLIWLHKILGLCLLSLSRNKKKKRGFVF
jgi:hypothetical protein